jgi:hypothetical protein
VRQTTPVEVHVPVLEPRTRSVLSTAVLCLMLAASSCGGVARTMASGPTTSAVPNLTAQQQLELRVQAMRRAFVGSRPVCMSAEASPGLRAEVATGFPSPVEYFDSREDLTVGSASDYRCVVIQPQNVRHVAPGVVGVDVWVMFADLNGRGETYLFRWDGTGWVDTTPEDAGVTVTTSVS